MSISNKIRGLREIWQFDNRWELIYGRLFNPGEREAVYRIKELRILVDHSAGDANGAREILTSDMYRQFLPFLDKSSALNVLDIGANNGGFPLLLRLEGFEIKKLVSVEFNPKTFARLKTNIESNIEADVELVNAAICGENRLVSVSDSQSGTSDSIYSESGSSAGGTVEGITFNELISRTFGDQTVDVCKMDIEGAEFEVFQNPGCERIRQCSILMIEIHHSSENRREKVIERLNELGFEELNGDNKRAEDLHFVHFFRTAKG